MVQDYDLKSAISTLHNGGLILYPTDTLWSLGCDATNPRSVERVYRLKRTHISYPAEVLVSSLEMLKDYVAHLHPRIETLLIYHLRPLTVLYQEARNLPPSLLGSDGSVAIRLVQDEYCMELIDAFGRPLMATPASIIDAPFPSTFGAISSEIIQGVDYVVKHRQKEKMHGEPSVMVRLSERDELVFLRE